VARSESEHFFSDRPLCPARFDIGMKGMSIWTLEHAPDLPFHGICQKLCCPFSRFRTPIPSIHAFGYFSNFCLLVFVFISSITICYLGILLNNVAIIYSKEGDQRTRKSKLLIWPYKIIYEVMELIASMR